MPNSRHLPPIVPIPVAVDSTGVGATGTYFIGSTETLGAVVVRDAGAQESASA